MKALALALIITCGFAFLVYAGLIIAELVRDMIHRKRFMRRFYR